MTTIYGSEEITLGEGVVPARVAVQGVLALIGQTSQAMQ